MEERAKQKYSEWLISVLAVLVIFQAIVLVGASFDLLLPRQQATGKATAPFLITQTKNEEILAKLAFVPANVSLKQGEVSTVDLVLTPQREIRLDGMDVVLVFDPEVFEVSSVTVPKLFSFVSQKKDKVQGGKIYATFLEEDSDGLSIKENTKLLSLTIKGKALGTSNLSILTAEEGPTTVLVENGTSQKITFDKEDLKVTVY